MRAGSWSFSSPKSADSDHNSCTAGCKLPQCMQKVMSWWSQQTLIMAKSHEVEMSPNVIVSTPWLSFEILSMDITNITGDEEQFCWTQSPLRTRLTYRRERRHGSAVTHQLAPHIVEAVSKQRWTAGLLFHNQDRVFTATPRAQLTILLWFCISSLSSRPCFMLKVLHLLFSIVKEHDDASIHVS